MCFFFFFSSRRRHTRCSRDWSSDVCSSDLFSITRNKLPPGQITEPINAQANPIIGSIYGICMANGVAQPLATRYRVPVQTLSRIARIQPNEIGRASCRERV